MEKCTGPIFSGSEIPGKNSKEVLFYVSIKRGDNYENHRSYRRNELGIVS